MFLEVFFIISPDNNIPTIASWSLLDWYTFLHHLTSKLEGQVSFAFVFLLLSRFSFSLCHSTTTVRVRVVLFVLNILCLTCWLDVLINVFHQICEILRNYFLKHVFHFFFVSLFFCYSHCVYAYAANSVPHFLRLVHFLFSFCPVSAQSPSIFYMPAKVHC